MEKGFRDGIIDLLCATTTLANGSFLPTNCFYDAPEVEFYSEFFVFVLTACERFQESTCQLLSW